MRFQLSRHYFMHIASPARGTSRRQIAMTCTLTMMAAISAMFTGPPALAAEPVHPQAMTKHQMIVQTVSCMRKRMSASKTISYNEAAKACKAQVGAQRGNSTSGPLVVSDAPAK